MMKMKNQVHIHVIDILVCIATAALQNWVSFEIQV